MISSLLLAVATAVNPFGEAQWIYQGYGGGMDMPPAATPIFRKAFTLEKAVEKPKLTITGLGYFECMIDGKKIGDYELIPSQTDYSKRFRYFVFDLSRLEAGRHIVSIELGDGFYNSTAKDVWNFEHAPWRSWPKTICLLQDSESGKTLLKTDATWKVRGAGVEYVEGKLTLPPKTPLTFNSIRGGEIYDARLEFPWDEVDGKEWIPVYLSPGPGGVPELETIEPCRVMKTHEMKKLDGTNLYKAPVNLAGGVRLTVKGERGAKVKMKFAEVLKDGHVWMAPIDCFVDTGLPEEQKTFQRDAYILKGEGVETWRTKFTYHGYQYCEVEIEGKAEILKLEALEIYNDVKRVGKVKTTDERINRVLAACEQSILANMQNLPTDCPQREKNGWLGDAFLRLEAALYAFDLQKIYENVVLLAGDTQHPEGQIAGIFPAPGWGYTYSGSYSCTSFVEIPDTLYRFTGATKAKAIVYPKMPRWKDHMARMRDERGVPMIGLWDWLHPLSCERLDWQYVRLMGYIRTLQMTPDSEAEYAEAKADAIKAFFKDGLPVYTNSAAYAFAIDNEVIAPEKRAEAAALMVKTLKSRNFKVDFGMNGVNKVFHTLGDYGYADEMFELMTQPEKPGYVYWTDTLGLTTLPERWDIDEKTDHDGSFCHAAFSGYMAAVYRYFAGFNHPLAFAGTNKILIKPLFPKQLQGLEAEHQGYKVEWKREGNKVIFRLEVPEGKRAWVELPGHETRDVGPGAYKYDII